MPWSKPETQAIRAALQASAPGLAEAPIAFLAEGWEFWAFTAGDFVLRFPKDESGLSWLSREKSILRTLELEQTLLPELAGGVSTPIPRIEFISERGPNGAPFAAHRMLPGEDILTTSRKPSPTFGRDAGRFIGELHAFPADRALALGVPLLEGPQLRTQRAQHYEDVIRRLFPLLSCEGRTRVEQVYETYLNTVANFVFEPCLVHQDLDCNMLIDERGDLCGVIDFGDALVSSAALDFWLPLYGLKRLGIEAQVPACLAAAGIEGAALETMRPEVDFLDFRFPLLDMLQGLDTHDDVLLEGGIQALNASLPRDIRC